jgi:hypothetical protein
LQAIAERIESNQNREIFSVSFSYQDISDLVNLFDLWFQTRNNDSISFTFILIINLLDESGSLYNKYLIICWLISLPRCPIFAGKMLLLLIYLLKVWFGYALKFNLFIFLNHLVIFLLFPFKEHFAP